MQLIYENALGRVLIRGGAGDGFNLIDVTGLSLPDTEAVTVRYPDVRGQTVMRISVLARTITLSGDVCDKTGVRISRAAAVFSQPGTLFVTNSRGTRKIACRCTSFSPAKRQGVFVPFTMQMIADDPYFQDLYESRVPIAKRTNLLKSPFTLPAIFSKRDCETDVLNRGVTAAEPVFEISSAAEASCPNGIVLHNLTTGSQIKLNTGISAGETLCIDIGKRTVTGSKRGNLLNTLDSAASLSKFSLVPGINRIKVIAEQETEPLLVVCCYRNSYPEAVI